MPQQLLIGSGKTGGRRRGGASRGNLVGGQYPNNLIGAGENGAGFFDTLGRVVENVVPLVPGIIGAVKGISGGTLKESNVGFHSALRGDKEILDNYGRKVEKAIKSINDLEKAKVITARDGTTIKQAIYDAENKKLTDFGKGPLASTLKTLEDWEAEFNRLITALSSAEPAARAAALTSLAKYVVPGEALPPVRNASELKTLQDAVHKRIVDIYGTLPTPAAKAQYLYNLITIGAQYLKKDGKESHPVKLPAQSDAKYPGWTGLIEDAHRDNLFIPKGYTLYKGVHGKTPINYYLDEAGQPVKLDSRPGRVKPYTEKYYNAIKDRAVVGTLPGTLADPEGINLGNPNSWGAQFVDDEDGAVQQGNGWGRY